jgi:putative nucleotidyltransferase with HDIG domain
MRMEGSLAVAGELASTDLPCVLVADEDPRTVDLVALVLGPDYDIVSAISVTEAIEIASHRRVRVALISATLPDAQGYTMCRRLRTVPGNTQLPILIATTGNDPRSIGRAMDAGATAFLMRPLQPKILRNRLSRLATVQVEQEWENLNPLQRSTVKLSHRAFSRLTASVISGELLPREDIEESSRALVEAAQSGQISAVLTAVRDHDNYTFVHSLRVAAHMTLFGVGVGMRDNDLLALAQAGLLHDIGKLRIPTSILNKPGALSGAEWDVMRGHVETSVSILSESAEMRREVVHVAARHHERLDGSGYPYGLKGSAIDEPSLVSAIVDVYTALTDRRSYKPAYAPEQALRELRSYAPGRLEKAYLRRFADLIMSE